MVLEYGSARLVGVVVVVVGMMGRVCECVDVVVVKSTHHAREICIGEAKLPIQRFGLWQSRIPLELFFRLGPLQQYPLLAVRKIAEEIPHMHARMRTSMEEACAELQLAVCHF